MFVLASLFPKIPLGPWVDSGIDWLTAHLSGLFDAIQKGGNAVMDTMTGALSAIPVWLFIIGMTIFAILMFGKKWGIPFFTFIGLIIVENQGLWSDLMSTFTLVIISSLISVIIGVPLGIWMAKNETVNKIVQPILDFMQTMPAFVYLIPAVAFFGIGVVPGVFASVIFALPPTVRMSNLGIRQVPTDLVEAADSFGSTGKQKLFKVELPLAQGTIFSGINQTLMLALSMVVIASMIGAPGLGRGVLSAVQNADIGKGFVNGFSLVVLAIIIDRFTQKLNRTPADKSTPSKHHWKGWTALAVAVAMIGGGVVTSLTSASSHKESVKLVYVQWDSEVASSNVLAQAMRQHGYQVDLTPLDNSIMWQSIANGQADASVSAWLPNTHKAQYKKYKNDIDLLGPNLKGATTGLVVPKYMKVDSIADLKNEAGKKVTAIEPGAGVTKNAEKAIKDYGLNSQGWQVTPSSSGAMAVALGKAIKAKQDIVVTGWEPHWMFQKYDLKYLKDPKKSFGGAESINTMTRKDLKQDKPDAYKVLKKFKWTKEDMGKVMLDIQNGKSPKQAANTWIKNNQSKVDSWFK
ncbi:ABC transporter permease/substrate binding protein [Weissella paramesenteroides]|jgi:glycine betaine/proline transport system substrate-binding protein|uniref:ABC transporter permease/substrate binding protein n=1 Tax=Weissella paramesenteroides TaxID=1249 RepID=UPI002E7B0381|nr:ABC transporter permease/substrate binding protein [Weissella paramesenteroides]WPQ67232.1 ABC transporter permease/substrate binding protein [Weissella paramesenteroides]